MIMINGIRLLVLLGCSTALLISCKRESEETPDPCRNSSFTVSGTPTNTGGCANNGGITVTASGGSGMTYSVDGTNYQTSSVFSNLAPGNYTVSAKDGNGCIKTAAVTIASGTPGTLFTQARSVITANCNSCHNASNSQGGMNWSVDCNIVNNRERIKARAVDAHGTAQQMPPPPNAGLSAADRQKITDWINAGGALSN